MASNGGSDDDKSASGNGSHGGQSSDHSEDVVRYSHAHLELGIAYCDVAVFMGENDERACPNCCEVSRDAEDLETVVCHEMRCRIDICLKCATDLGLWTVAEAQEAQEAPAKRRKSRKAKRTKRNWWCPKHFPGLKGDYPKDSIVPEDCVALVAALVAKDAKERGAPADAYKYFKAQMARLEEEGFTVEARIAAAEPSPSTDLP